MIDWTTYFKTQADIRDDYERRARDVVQKYQRMSIEQPTRDAIGQMARMNKMYAEMNALNEECEAELADVEKPSGVKA